MENSDLKSLFARCSTDTNFLTIEATVDTGFEFMAVDECKDKFGENVDVIIERGRIIFIVDKSLFPKVMEMRSIDNVYLVIGCLPLLNLTKQKDEDLNTIKAQVHVPDWEHWLSLWCDLMKFQGIVKPTPEQYEAASARVRQEKEIEKAQQAERQARHKERQERQAKFRAERQERWVAANVKKPLNSGEDIASQDDVVSSQIDCQELKNEALEIEDRVSVDAKATEEVLEASNEPDIQVNEGEGDRNAKLDNFEVESLPDDEKEKIEETEINDIPASERVLRFRATCYRTGKHEFTSMQAACEFGGELQQKFNWVVDLTKFDAEVVLWIDKEEGHVALALTRESLHRRNIKFFGPTTLRATVCHNLLRLAELQPGEIVVDPLAGGGSICIEGAVAFKDVFNLGGEIYHGGVNRMYSNVRALRSDGHSLALDMARWDARRLPLREASVDVVVSDMPFGVRMSSKFYNRPLYKQVLREMARVVRPIVGRAILLTLDRKNFGLALASTRGLWWQSRVISANIGGLDAAVFTLKRTDKLRLTDEDLEADKNWRDEPREDSGSWKSGSRGGFNRSRGGRGGRGGCGSRSNYHRR